MYDDVTWFPICAGLSALGLVAAFFAFRRRGAASGLRLLGWAALPMAIYLTGMVRLLWTIGSEIVTWIAGFVFRPTVWAGLALFAFAAITLPVAAMLRRRRIGTADDTGTTPAVQAGKGGATGASKAGELGTGTSQPAGKSKPVREKKPAGEKKAGKESDPLEGLEDVEEILKRRGIS